MSWLRKRTNGYLAGYRGPDKVERNKMFRRKIDAERWLAGIEVSKARGEWLDPALSQITLGSWCTEHFLPAQQQLKPTTRVRYEAIVEKHIRPRWRNVALAEVAPADVAAWLGELSASGLAPATVHYIHRVLALALKYAVLDGRLSRNPAAGVPLPRATARPKVFLTHAQVQQLADECGEYATLIYVLGYTGLRWGEVAALRVRDLDLMRRRLHVEQAMAEVKGRAELGTPKDHERRSVPIPEFLLTDLEKAIAARGHRPDDLLFPAPEGGFLRNGNFRKRVFDSAAKRAGIVGVTPHGLRHTAASLAVQAGASVLAVCRMLGHSSPKVTLEVYAKLFDDDLDTLASRLHTAKIKSDADQVRTNRRVIMLPERAASGRDAV